MPRKPAFISHSPEREAEIQSRLLDVLEARFRRQFRNAIRTEGERIAGKYRDLGFVPSASEEHMQDIRRVYRDLAIASARTFGRRIVSQGKAAGLILETKQTALELFLAIAMAWVQQEAIRRRIVSVTETTREQIINIVAQGVEDGLGIDAIASLIAERVQGISKWRGALIARTETHGAANFAAHEVAKTTGLDIVKQWVSVEDARTRSIGRDDEFDHVSMDGQIREMDEPFDMPWTKSPDNPLRIMYPGEAGHPGGATINCRCASVQLLRDLVD